MIELLKKGDFGFGIIEEIELDMSVDETAEFDANEPDELAALVYFFEEFLCIGDQLACLCGVGYAALFGEGIEVGIADLDGDAAGEA